MQTTKNETSWVENTNTPSLIKQYQQQGVYIEEKTGWLWKTIATMLWVITFGFYKKHKFLEQFATTLGPKVGIPRSWTYAQVEYVMPHEARHVWQGKVCGFWISAWLGLPIFGILYLLLPIPIGFAYFRYLFERDATRETIRHLKKQQKSTAFLYQYAKHSATTVASNAYVWAVPVKFAIKGYKHMVDQVIAES